MLLKLSPIFLIIAYLVVSVLQFSASFEGIVHFFGLNWFFAGAAGLILVFIPAIGPMAGVYGAVVVWKWSLLGAIFLFFWPYFLAGLFMLFGATSYFLLLKRYFKPFSFYSSKTTDSKETDIEPDFNVKETKSTSEKQEVLEVEYKEKV